MDYSVCVTVFEKEWLIPRVVRGIIDNSLDFNYEIIFTIDGCTDNSEEAINQTLHSYRNAPPVKFLYGTSLFETRANNLGLMESKGKYSVICQDDCIVQDPRWLSTLSAPMEKWNNILCCSGRDVHNIYINDPTWRDISNKTNRRDGVIAIRKLANRGPLLYSSEKIKKLGYLDESWIQGYDEHDASARGFKEYGYKVCGTNIGFCSQDEWGSTRNGPNTGFIAQLDMRNKGLFFKKHQDFIELPNWDSDIG